MLKVQEIYILSEHVNEAGDVKNVAGFFPSVIFRVHFLNATELYARFKIKAQ